MTSFSIGTQCPSCSESIRLPLLRGEDAEGRFLEVKEETLVDHAKACEVNR